MSTIKWLLVGAATFYVVIVVAVFVVQRSLQYFPDVRRTSPAAAGEQPVGRLILEPPFPSGAAVGGEVCPYLPGRLLRRDQFRSDARIANVSVPVLVLQGVRDAMVPIKCGERLFALIKGPKKF